LTGRRAAATMCRVGQTEPEAEMRTPPSVACLVSAPTDRAREIATAVVERRLAACVNIVPVVESIYRWEGAVARDEESLLVIKTTRAAVEPLISALGSLHPYANFELIALDIEAGAAPYLRWIGESVGPA
jgi:periplasmic divalent cation tolerance protein